MQRFSSLLVVSIAALGVVLAGCDSTSSDSSGALSVTMDGASKSSKAFRASSRHRSTAADVDTALVTIEKISIVPAEKTDESGGPEVGVTALTDSNFTVDLKKLQSGIEAILPDIEIPTGTYSQLRLVTAGKAQISFTDTNGIEEVMIASGQQTGLKVNFPKFRVQNADDRVDLTVSWDVEESLKGSGSGTYVITPAINDATPTVTSAPSDDGTSN